MCEWWCVLLTVPALLASARARPTVTATTARWWLQNRSTPLLSLPHSATNLLRLFSSPAQWWRAPFFPFQTPYEFSPTLHHPSSQDHQRCHWQATTKTMPYKAI
ncbi:hypothetical protein GBAR_LOCUS8924 [Geodia barretti]|uniref:Secreted protein n=1 Tax=Geodia barretti TaxID=519541 RepID=A0AA35RNB6_GEOBA|nr:hypothetical protein GBAR_LOCUS8924 [Geodia barretti]